MILLNCLYHKMLNSFFPFYFMVSIYVGEIKIVSGEATAVCGFE